MKSVPMLTPSFFRRSELTHILWSFRREFLAVGVFSLVINLLHLSPTLYMIQVFDRVITSQSFLTLLVLSLITLFLFMVGAFADWVRNRLLVRAGVAFDERLSRRVFHASFEQQRLDARTPSGRAFADLVDLRQFLTGTGVHAFFDAPWIPIYIAVLFVVHPFLGWCAIGFVMLQASMIVLAQRMTAPSASALSQAQGQANTYLQNKLRHAEVVEALGMLDNLQTRWRRLHTRFLQVHAESGQQGHTVGAWSKYVRGSLQSLSLAAGAFLVVQGELGAGAMIASNLLIARALAPLDGLVAGWRGWVSARQAFGRLEKLLLDHPEPSEDLPRVPPQGFVQLKGVQATAPGRPQAILRGVDLRLKPGTVTVIQGPSGSGKSTLARVMLGIWPGETQGEVLLDDLPLASWDREQIGPLIGYLPQDIELLDGTVAENIARFGEISSPAVIEAARCVGLHDTLLRLPAGYDTPILAQGGLLSGGQRQRLGLARAVHGWPRLIVLDEPNANLDDVGEAALARAVRTLRERGSTVVMISHRPGALELADQLVVMHEGRVVHAGPRAQVLARLLEEPPQASPSNLPAPPNSAQPA